MIDNISINNTSANLIRQDIQDDLEILPVTKKYIFGTNFNINTYFLYYIPHNKSNLLVSLLQAYEGV